jgi:hypothetical protein
LVSCGYNTTSRASTGQMQPLNNQVTKIVFLLGDRVPNFSGFATHIANNPQDRFCLYVCPENCKIVFTIWLRN